MSTEEEVKKKAIQQCQDSSNLLPTGLRINYYETESCLDLILLNKQKINKPWFIYNKMKEFEKKMQTSKDLNEKISYMVSMAENYRQNKLYGESSHLLNNAKSMMEKILSLQYDPSLDFLYSKCLFYMAKLYTDVKRIPEAKLLMESSSDRLQELIQSLFSRHITPSKSSPITLCKILLAEVFLEQALELLKSKQFAIACLDYLLEALRAITTRSDESDKKTVTILNLTIFRRICLHIASCLKEFEEFNLARHYASKAQNSFVMDSDIDEEDDDRNEIKDLIDSIEVAEKQFLEKKEKMDNPSQNSRNKFFGNDDDDDDWFSGENDEWDGDNQTGGLLKLDEDPEEVSDPIQEELFPQRHKLLQVTDSRNEEKLEEIKVIRDEEQPVFLTLRMKDEKNKFDGYGEMKKWISSLVGFQKESTGSSPPNEKYTNEKLIVENLDSDLNYLDKFSLKWAQCYYDCCWRLYCLNTREASQACWSVLSNYFNQLPNAKVTQNVDEEDVKKLISLFHISIALLRIAARMWKPSESSMFDTMADTIKKFYQKQADMVTLVEMEAICHNSSHLLDEDPEFLAPVIPTLLEVFVKHFAKADQCPVIDGYSVTTKNYMTIMPSSVDIACHALILIHLYTCGISPLSLQILVDDDYDYGMIELDDQYDANAIYLVDDLSYRMDVLRKLYVKLPCMSIVKALAAHLIALYNRYYLHNITEAENASFESVYILSKTPGIIDSSTAITSDIGTKMLIEFAEILSKKKKYSLAAVAFSQAIENYKICFLDYDYQLVSKLAHFSSENDDWKRSVKYYQILLSKAQAEKNVAEVVYISEKLSEEYMARGDFRHAEECFTSSVEFVKSSSSKTTTAVIHGDYELNQKLKLAHLFLQGYYFERGIDLLAKLMEGQLTPFQKCLVFTNLAEAYLKKRWLKECEEVLNKIGPLLEKRVLKETKGVDEIRVLVIATQCYYRKGNYAYAIYCVNIALQKACTFDSKRSPVLAKLFHLKGKILHAVSSSYIPSKFPTSLNEHTSKNPLFQQFSENQKITISTDPLYGRRVTYCSAEEVLQDCLKCFDKASELYHSLSDRRNCAKVWLRTAKAKIDYIFSAVCMLNEEPDAIVSSVLQNLYDMDQIDMQNISPTLDIAIRTSSVFLTMDSYITMAELRYLQGRRVASQLYWTECRNLIFALFMEDCEVVVSKGAPPGFLERLFNIVKRLVRLLYCFDCTFINSNFALIDAFLLLEIELSQVFKRQGDYDPDFHSNPIINESNLNSDVQVPSARRSMDIGSDNESSNNSNGSTLILQNKIYQALPFNSSVNKSKTLPFLRRKKVSLHAIYSAKPKRTALSGSLSKKPTESGNLSSSSSNSHTSSDGFLDSLIATEEITERVWSCFFRMKQNGRKHSDIHELRNRNEQSLRTLLKLMKALRCKSSDKGKRLRQSNSNPEMSKTGIAHTESFGSLGDTEYSSNPVIDDSHPLMSRIVFILQLDDILVYYIPKIGFKSFQKFGGKKIDNMNKNEKNLVSGFSLLKVTSGSITSEISKHLSGKTHDPFDASEWLSEEHDTYLTSMITQGRREKEKNGVEKSKAIVDSLTSKIFTCAPFSYSPDDPHGYTSENDIKVHTEASAVASGNDSSRFDHLRNAFSLKKVPVNFSWKKTSSTNYIPTLQDAPQSSTSILLICSHFLQHIPWELMFKQFITRSFSVQSELIRLVQKKSNPNKESCIPAYFTFYSEDESKYIAPLEKERKDWLSYHVKKKNNVTPCDPGILHDNLPNIPIHSPLIKYGKKVKSYKSRYKYVNFVRLSVVAENATQIVTQVENYLSSHQCPIFLFTIADLIDLSDAILCLLSYRPDCTLLFLPEAQMINATEFLMDIQSLYTKNGQLGVGNTSLAAFLTHSIHSLRKHLNIPVVMVNAPIPDE